jgi:signal transduction histidine kinase
MNLPLLIHNIGYIISIFATLIAIFFLLLNNPREKGHIPLILTCVATIVFIISHLIGVNTIDPIISKRILMFNLSVFFIGMFNVHAFLSFLGKVEVRKKFLISIYVCGVSIVLWFILNPDYFLLPSIPKMYFPNYYVPGKYNWFRELFLYGICIPYMFFILVTAYKETRNVYNKKQLKYLIIGFLLAYGIGFIPNFLIYNIQFDPVYGMLFMILFAGAFLYGAIKYELMNIKVIAKQASIYSLAIGFIGALIVLLEYLNTYIRVEYPDFPGWAIPSFSIILVLFIALLVWRKMLQVDLLKNEFITTVTHKFRTPLTQIKWSTENLKKSIDEENRENVVDIQSAIEKLVELTNLLVAISETDSISYKYDVKSVDLKNIAEEAIMYLNDLIREKKMKLNVSLNPNMIVHVDPSRIKFVIQTLIENAINYNSSNGEISISLYSKNDKAVFSITDSGIGISERELPLIFTKFYRGNNARTVDTEGMGIGLFISKEIIVRHNGKIGVESRGLNKGSTFTFALPLHK